MKTLKIICISIFLLLQFWMACSLAKIASAVNVNKKQHELRVRTNASVSGDISVMSHDFTPHWK